MFTKCRLTCALFLLCISVCDMRGQDGPTVEVSDSQSEQVDVGSSSLQRLPVEVSITEKVGYDTRVNTSAFSANQGSSFTQSGINLNYVFGTSRTQASLRTGADVSYYPELDKYNPNLDLRFELNREASRRLRLITRISAKYGAEPNFSLSADPEQGPSTVNRRVGNYLSSTNFFSASYQWLPRFSTVTSYTLALVQYDEKAIAAVQNRIEHRFGQQFRYLLLPSTTIVGEYRLALRSYDDGSRDSTTNTLLSGIDQTFNSRLSGSIRGGVQFRSAELAGGNSTRPYFSSDLKYVLGEKTAINWINRYSIEEPDEAESGSRISFNSGLGLKYAVSPRISTSLNVFYRHSSNDGGGSTALAGNRSTSEDSLALSFMAGYAVNRHLSANIGYTNIEVDSARVTRSYSRSRYSVGLKFTF